jgi:hypothetical protein
VQRIQHAQEKKINFQCKFSKPQKSHTVSTWMQNTSHEKGLSKHVNNDSQKQVQMSRKRPKRVAKVCKTAFAGARHLMFWCDGQISDCACAEMSGFGSEELVPKTQLSQKSCNGTTKSVGSLLGFLAAHFHPWMQLMSKLKLSCFISADFFHRTKGGQKTQ